MLPVNRQSVSAQYQQALALHRKGALAQAEALYRSILKVAPNLAEAHFQCARIAQTQGNLDQAHADLERALALKPREPALWTLAAELHATRDDRDAALAAHDQLIALEPNAVKPVADKAVYLQSLGDFDQADRLMRRLIKKHPYDGELYRVYLGGKKLKPGDPLIGQMSKALKHPKQNPLGKMHLGYALAKAMEETGKTDKVFGYLRLANGIQKKTYPFDRAAKEVEQRAVLAAQKDIVVRPDAAPGQQATPRPIFVTGMPRSGTTLVERILAAHSTVSAGGETGFALKLAYQAFGAAENIRPWADITPEDLAGFARTYRAALHGAAGRDAAVVTDKSMKSELIFGLIHAAMPDARIVVVHRDPRAVALSIYKNHFLEGRHRYANDLADIAWTIHQFEQAVAFWKARLPGVVHSVHYEDLVSDPEAQTRSLIAGAGLSWEEACLRPHEVGGAVKTLSLQQVRQPIQANRVASWAPFENDLKPFTDAWEALTS